MKNTLSAQINKHKYWLLLWAILTIGVYFLFKLSNQYKKSIDLVSQVAQNEMIEKPSIFEALTEPVYGQPLELSIESLNLKLDLTEVGVASDGSLATPKDWNLGGWYTKSAKTAQTGNMIINAHYDDNYGRPAAFYQLKNIQLSDKVVVFDEYGEDYDYFVTDKFLLDINDPSRLDVLKTDVKEPVMTLITCGGVWIPGQSTYNKRLVVKAELAK